MFFIDFVAKEFLQIPSNSRNMLFVSVSRGSESLVQIYQRIMRKSTFHCEKFYVLVGKVLMLLCWMVQIWEKSF